MTLDPKEAYPELITYAVIPFGDWGREPLGRLDSSRDFVSELRRD